MTASINVVVDLGAVLTYTPRRLAFRCGPTSLGKRLSKTRMSALLGRRLGVNLAANWGPLIG